MILCVEVDCPDDMTLASRDELLRCLRGFGVVEVHDRCVTMEVDPADLVTNMQLREVPLWVMAALDIPNRSSLAAGMAAMELEEWWVGLQNTIDLLDGVNPRITPLTLP